MNKILSALFLIAFSISALGQSQGVSQRATNGVAFARMTVQSHINATNTTSTNTFAGKFQQGSSTATGVGASAFGSSGLNAGQYGFLTGIGNQVMSSAGNASGISNIVSGAGATVEGIFNVAGGLYSHAGGVNSYGNGVGTFVHGNEVAMDTGSDYSWAGGHKIVSGAYLSNSLVWNGDYGTILNMDGYSNIVVIKSLGGIALIGSEIVGDGGGLTNLNVDAGAASTNEIFSYVLSNAVAVGATSVLLDRAAAFPATSAGRIFISWGKTNCEVRSATSVSGNVIGFSGALAIAHEINDRVVWTRAESVYPSDMKIIPATGTDSGWETLQMLEQGVNQNLEVDGTSLSIYSKLPYVTPNSAKIKNISFNAISGYPLGNTNVYMMMGRQGGRYAFTASSATDKITVPGGWSPPGSGTNIMVVFYDLGAGTLPQPLSNGIPYFVMTNSSTELNLKANWNDASFIDLTSDGSGVMCSEAGSGGKSYFRDVYFNGQTRPGINGLWLNDTQPSYYDGFLRIDNCRGTALRLTGQQARFDNVEIIASGIGLDLRRGPTDDSGAQFMYFDSLNIEQFYSNAIVGGGGNNHFSGVHIETTQSSSLPIIDYSSGGDVMMDNFVYGGSALPNTNTVFQMGTAGIPTSYDFRNIYISGADFDSIQLALNDLYRGFRVYAYNSTNGSGTRRIGRLFAPEIPTSSSYASYFGGETWIGRNGAYLTGPQQNTDEDFIQIGVGTNQAGPALRIKLADGTKKSGFGSNGDLIPPATVVWASSTNSIALNYPWTAHSWVMTGDAAITGITGNVAGYPSAATFRLNNNTGSNCTLRFPNGFVSYGSAITNLAFVIPDGKRGKVAIDFDGGTNVAAALQP